jgi:hypothetical protein
MSSTFRTRSSLPTTKTRAGTSADAETGLRATANGSGHARKQARQIKMTDEDRDDGPTDYGQDLEVEPASEEAYSSLELTQLSESEVGGHNWLPDGE